VENRPDKQNLNVYVCHLVASVIFACLCC